VDEQIRMSIRKAGEESPRSSLVTVKSSELPAYPADKMLIEVIPNLTKCRWVETPIVGIPASQDWIENLMPPPKVDKSLRCPCWWVDIAVFFWRFPLLTQASNL